MSDAQRFQRQVMLPEIGEAGQAKLKAARVLIVGVGGLGCPAALYLSSVGVGHLTLLDHDRVDISNLHRQVLFGSGDVGDYKALKARERLLGTEIHIDAVTEALSPSNALQLVRAHDFVLDCSDNFRTRYLLSDASAIAKKTLLTAAISRFDAEIALLCDNGLPCYRCLFPEFAASGKIQNCAEAGVLGSFVGVVGSMQAHELVKAIVGLSRMKGRLLCYQGLDNEISQYAIDKNPHCSCCGRLNELESFPMNSGWPLPLPDDFCVLGAETRIINKEDLASTLSDSAECLLIDVREAVEFQEQHIRGAKNFALSELQALPDAWRHRDLIIYCLSGVRSKRAVAILQERGFSRVVHLEGGIRTLQVPGSEYLLSASSRFHDPGSSGKCCIDAF